MSKAQEKIELLIELKNKLFNEKLIDTQHKLTNATKKMRGSIDKLKTSHIRAFNAMKAEVPGLGRALDLVTNKYVLMAAGIAGIGMLAYSATKKAAAFNHEFLQIQNLNLDKSKAELDSYKGLIKDTAFTIGTDLNKTTQAFYDVQSATGYFGDDVKTIVEEVGKFSLATGSDLNDSINATVKAMKAFNLSSKDTKMLLESNAKTVQVGITTFAELAQVQTEYAGAAAGAGQTVDTANKIFAAFTSIAKDSRTAATMTKTAFEGLTQKNTIKGLESIGISMYDANGNMRDLSKVLGEVSSKFKNMSSQQIDELINKIGGPEGLRNLFVKLKTGSEDFFKTLEAFDSSKFNLDKALKNAKGDVTTLANIVKNRWNVVMTNLGEKILPVVARALDWVNNILTSAYDIYNKYSTAINTAVIAIGTIITVIKLWKVAQIGLNLVLMANPIGLIVAAVAGLITGITYLISKTEGWKAQWQNLKEVMSLMWKGLKLEWDILTQGLTNGMMWAVDGIIKAWKWGLNKIGKLSDEQYKKDIARIDAEADARKKKLDGYISDYQKTVKQIKDTASWKLKWKSDKEETTADNKTNNLLGQTNPIDSSINGGSLDSELGKQVTGVTGAAAQVRNITVNIGALNEGGINTEHTTLQNMDADEIEQWFNESMMRVIRNVELSMS